jgi:hypothetical protein
VRPARPVVWPSALRVEGTRCNDLSGLIQESPVTVMLRCLGCGFSFTVTYPKAGEIDANTIPVACGHCRGTRWTSDTA